MAYGNECSCCRCNVSNFLQLDHVNGGGRKHTKDKGAYAHYRDARDRKFPSDYRLLCANCNRSAFWGNGVCIHQRKESGCKE